MIKKYQQFIKGKTNEEFEFAEPAVKPAPTTTPTKTPEKAPSPPQIIPGEQNSPVPAPAKAELPEEEGNEYIGQKLMAELSEMLGKNIESDGSINYEGKKINFYSETEKFHVDNKKFSTPEEVVNYLNAQEEPNALDKETKLMDIDEDEFEKGDVSFESKSYRNTRKKK